MRENIHINLSSISVLQKEVEFVSSMNFYHHLSKVFFLFAIQREVGETFIKIVSFFSQFENL